ncbi:MAG: helix-turn-helix transcriptional regulator [Clostridiales bacterium]|nr:helix-turn-helix transcriptional regulator [Clostridiales bacterium]
MNLKNRDSNSAAYMLDCSYLESDAGNDIPHSHDYIELVYVMSSALDVTVNKIGYRVSGGDMLVLIPGDVHEFHRQKGCRYMSIRFSRDFLFGSILSSDDLRYSTPLSLSRYPGARILRSDEIDDTDVPRKFHNILTEFNAKSNFYRLSIRADLSAIALFVFKRWDRLEKNISDKNHVSDPYDVNGRSAEGRLSAVIDKIDSCYHEDLTAQNMSELAGMSYSYFSRFFKATMGYTFSEYLNSVRIKASEKLLVETDEPVSSIALKVGFTSTSYYISNFKKQLHLTPKKYRTTFRRR